MIEKLAQATDIRAALVVGGLSMQVQASTLKTSPEIVVATPVSPPPPSWFSCALLVLHSIREIYQLMIMHDVFGSGYPKRQFCQ